MLANCTDVEAFFLLVILCCAQLVWRHSGLPYLHSHANFKPKRLWNLIL